VQIVEELRWEAGVASQLSEQHKKPALSVERRDKTSFPVQVQLGLSARVWLYLYEVPQICVV